MLEVEVVVGGGGHSGGGGFHGGHGFSGGHSGGFSGGGYRAAPSRGFHSGTLVTPLTRGNYGGYHGSYGGYRGGYSRGYYRSGYWPLYWGLGFGAVMGWPYYYGSGYGYGWPYYDSSVVPPTYNQQPQYLYYCTDPQGFYPDITNCLGGWLTVIPDTNQPSP